MKLLFNCPARPPDCSSESPMSPQFRKLVLKPKANDSHTYRNGRGRHYERPPYLFILNKAFGEQDEKRAAACASSSGTDLRDFYLGSSWLNFHLRPSLFNRLVGGLIFVGVCIATPGPELRV